MLFDINQPSIEYVTGGANIARQFFKNLSLCMLGSAIIFLLCMHRYSGWIGYLYIIYQAIIQTVIIIASIKYSGITAIIRAIFIYIPINFALLFLLIILYSYLYTKACKEWKYKQQYGYRFKKSNYWYCLLSVIVFQIILYVIAYLLIPILLRGIYIISF